MEPLPSMTKKKPTTMRRETLLVDSGFFIALLDPRDHYHAEAGKKEEWLDLYSLIVPWPVLYETVNTRFARQLTRRPANIARFENLVLRSEPETIRLDDSSYRHKAYADTLARAKEPRGSTRSLVDAILHAIIKDPEVHIDAMLTFNLRDFGSVCQSNRVELL